MTELQPACLDQASRERAVASLIQAWKDGDPDVRRFYPSTDGNEKEVFRAIRAAHAESVKGSLFINDTYQVLCREHEIFGKPGVWLSIKRLDRATIHDWRDIQEIKNQLVGPECEGVELYPAESRLVDTANQYHCWVINEPGTRFPFGFMEERVVRDNALAGSVQRPFEKPINNNL